MKDLISKFRRNALQVGEIVANEERIKTYFELWVDLNDKNRRQTFLRAVEADKRFAQVVKFSQFIRNTLAIGYEPIKHMRQAVENLDIFHRFIAMLYVGMKNGIVYTDRMEARIVTYGDNTLVAEAGLSRKQFTQWLNNRPAVANCIRDLEGFRGYKEFKRIVGKYEEGLKKLGIYFMYYNNRGVRVEFDDRYQQYFAETLFSPKGKTPYRIGNWHQPHAKAIAQSFGIESQFRTWDEEKAIDSPLKRSWDFNWAELAQEYLKRQGGSNAKVIQEHEKLGKVFSQLLKIDQQLAALKLSTAKLRNVLGVKDLYREHGKYAEALPYIQNAAWCSGNTYVCVLDKRGVDNDPHTPAPINVEYLRDSQDSRHWVQAKRPVDTKPVKRSWSEVVVVQNGRVVFHNAMPDYYRYGDFLGGTTERVLANQIKRVDHLKGSVLFYENGNGHLCSLTLK